MVIMAVTSHEELTIQRGGRWLVVLIVGVAAGNHCRRNHHFFLGGKVHPERSEADKGQLETGYAKGDANDGNHKEDPREDGLQGQNPAHRDGPHHVKDTVPRIGTTPDAVVLNRFTRVDHAFAEREEQEPSDLDHLPPARDTDTGQTQNAAGDKPGQRQVPAAHQQPDQVPDPRTKTAAVVPKGDLPHVRLLSSSMVIAVVVTAAAAHDDASLQDCFANSLLTMGCASNHRPEATRSLVVVPRSFADGAGVNSGVVVPRARAGAPHWTEQGYGIITLTSIAKCLTYGQSSYRRNDLMRIS
jgi:hypothetical protein